MIPETGNLSDEQRREVLDAARDYLREFNITYEQLAKALGTSNTYISQLFSRPTLAASARKVDELPPKTRDKLIRQLNRWLEEDYRGRLAQRPANFVETRIAAKVLEAARYTRELRTISVVDGPAGCGKTVCCDFVAEQLPGTMVIRVNKDCRTPRGLLAKIHQVCKLRRSPRTVPSLSDVVNRLKDSGRLLVIDQAHELRGAGPFALLQDLHDECDLPIMLLGTIDIHKQLSDDDPNFGQLSSRVGIRVHLLDDLLRSGKGGRRLQWISLDELRRIFAGTKLKLHPDVWGYLCQIANFELGYLRRVKWLIRLAEAAARGAKANMIMPAHLQTALHLVHGERRPLPALDRPPATAEATG